MSDLLAHADRRAARDEAINRATGHADAVEPAWSERAYAHLLAYPALPRGAAFMAEDVRKFAEEQGLPTPPDPRAWGGVVQRAVRVGIIESAGFGYSKNRRAHLRPTAIWRRAG